MSLPHSRRRSGESALLLALPAPPQLIRVMQINRNADVFLGERSIWQGAVMILIGLGLARLILDHDISRLLRFLLGMSSIFFQRQHATIVSDILYFLFKLQEVWGSFSVV